ncbi:hypothetical protein [Saccharopolyspora elongata]|nr:hypothetical protein [Saccharopolyspora elongata]
MPQHVLPALLDHCTPRHLVVTDDATPEHELAAIRASGTEVRVVPTPPP